MAASNDLVTVPAQRGLFEHDTTGHFTDEFADEFADIPIDASQVIRDAARRFEPRDLPEARGRRAAIESVQ